MSHSFFVAVKSTKKGKNLQNTFTILIICNIVHFFSTPYLMMQNSLSKMNAFWETTAMLMGDNWAKTIIRVVTPNAFTSLLEVFSYYFVNAMVTISAVVFIAGARTMVLTTKIKELQYYNRFNEVFVLSLLILFTNIAGKAVFQKLADLSRKKEIKNMRNRKRMKQITAAMLTVIMGVSAVTMTGCGGSKSAEEQVIIYSNADEEAIEAMSETLDENGYKDQYIFQTFGTSELGGKLLAEGKNLEADMVTMSTFYVDSAQEENKMFKDLEFDVNTLDEFGTYCAPITSQEGPIITTFYYPAKSHYSFEELYDYVKERGYAIYPGKITAAETFRIGNIGEIYKEDIELLCSIFATFLKEKGDKIA